jgi:hypothetical protein
MKEAEIRTAVPGQLGQNNDNNNYKIAKSCLNEKKKTENTTMHQSSQ